MQTNVHLIYTEGNNAVLLRNIEDIYYVIVQQQEERFSSPSIYLFIIIILLEIALPPIVAFNILPRLSFNNLPPSYFRTTHSDIFLIISL